MLAIRTYENGGSFDFFIGHASAEGACSITITGETPK